MAAPAPLNLQTISDAINVAYTQSTDTPLITDTDGILRLNLINRGIDRWQFFNQVRWRELYKYNTQGPTIVSGQIVYPITQSDFRELSSRLRILRSDGSYVYVNIVSPEYYARYMDQKGTVEFDSAHLVACVTGNIASGYQFNLGWVPGGPDDLDTVGCPFYFDYYKWANKMAVMTDVPEMQNSQFLVMFGTGELFVDDDVDLWTIYNTQAMQMLADMSAENDLLPDYESNAIEDQGEWSGGTGLRMGV